MKSITTQREARHIQNFEFCYLCGRRFSEGDTVNRDHVPPRSVFKKEDRNFPLKLRVHADDCHAALNLDDEVIGQLVSILHGNKIYSENDKIQLKGYLLNNSKALVAFDKQRIEPLLQRWLRGFYAALYGEPLHFDTKFCIQAPLPVGKIIDGKFEKVDPLPIFAECLQAIEKSQEFDEIISNNGKFIFRCVWDKLSDGSWAGIFHINLYQWSRLGDFKSFGNCECVGLFSRPDGKKPG